MDTSDSASLHPMLANPLRILQDDKVIGVLKPQVLTPRTQQNGPLLANHSHLAQITGDCNIKPALKTAIAGTPYCVS